MTDAAQPSIEVKVLARTVEGLYATTPLGFLLLALAVPFTVLIGWGSIPVSYVMRWAMLTAVVFAFRFGIFWWFSAHRVSHSDQFWLNLFRAGLAAAALLWAAMPWMIFGHTDIFTAGSLYILVAVAPLVSVNGLAFDRMAIMIFPITIYPASALWWLTASGQGQNIGWISLLFSILFIPFARRANAIAAGFIRQAVELEQARQEAEAAHRSKSEFLASMSHELRTPLNAVIGFSQIIAEGHFGQVQPARYQDYAQDILASGRHLLSLISDVLDLSKLEAGRMPLEETFCAPEGLIHAAVRMTQAIARKSAIEIETAVSDGLPRMLLDERAVLQILLNLLANAIKFSPRGGTVWVRAMPAADGGLRIEVQDAGPGMSAENAQKAFELFSTLPGAAGAGHIQSTGLGLAISKSLAEQHGGSLALETAPGEGVKAILLLPASRIAP